MPELQSIVGISVIAILLLSAALAAYITRVWLRKRTKPYLYWSIGMWLFAIDVLLELFFAYGTYTQFLIKFYLFTVALIVLFLSLGSLELTSWKRTKLCYIAFAVAASLLLLYSLMASSIGNIITEYIVFGNLPLIVILASSIVTFPAAIVLVLVAGLSYRRKRSNKMLSIIAGTVIVSIAGTLYIASYPEFLYLSEFLGILLLWIGFI